MSAFHTSATCRSAARKLAADRFPAFEGIALVAALFLVTSPAPAQTPEAGGQTPKQPTANDASVGLPEQPASMSKNPVAMSPDAARSEGTAKAAPDAGK